MITSTEPLRSKYFNQYSFIATYTKIETARNDILTVYDFTMRVAKPSVPLAVLCPYFVVPAAGNLILSRLFHILRLVRPMVYKHKHYARIPHVEQENWEDFNQNSSKADDHWEIATMIGSVFIFLHYALKRLD